LSFHGKVREERRERSSRTQGRRRVRGVCRFGTGILAVLAALSGACLASTETNPAGEYQVKAAFLYHFAQFVEWPEETFKDASSPLTYCTIGEDPFQGSLDTALNGKTIGTRSFRVLHFRQSQEIQDCQVLFIGAGEKKLLGAILASIKGNAILTVGDSQHFVQEGGMIGFCLEVEQDSL
jgi:YfiR/HmsC-like